MSTSRPFLLVALAALSLGAAAPSGPTQIATVAAVRGTVEVQRGEKGEWQPTFAGNPLFAGERVRSDASGGATLVFTDDCVIVIGPGTTLTADQYGGKPRRALFRLDGGAVEAMVSGYGGEAARWEIETASAVVRVQGTRFVVRQDSANRATDVAGIDGEVAVQGRTGLIGPGVAVGPGQISRVESGKFPSPVRELTAEEKTQMTAGLTLLGSGGRSGLDTDNPLLDGRVVADSDRPQLSSAKSPYLKPAVPDDPLMYRLSPDIRANTQPLPVYEAVPPNEVPQPPR